MDDRDFLTTGEASALLGCTRQHIVNMCNRGQLTYTFVGKHRRIPRTALEAPVDLWTRDQRRSLWLAFAAAGEIVRNPQRAIALAKANLVTIRGANPRMDPRWLDRWYELLDGPVEELLRRMTSGDHEGSELRQQSPFAGLLTDEDRQVTLKSFREADLEA